jgi:hypothetical protein
LCVISHVLSVHGMRNWIHFRYFSCIPCVVCDQWILLTYSFVVGNLWKQTRGH